MEESQNVEWKESWRDEYLKWICGFANAQGGKIYIGVNDRREVIGVEKSKKLLEDIPNKIINTLGIVADVNLLKENDKEYIEIIVSANPYPVNYRGEYHYRTGSTKQQLTGTALNQFLLRKTGITWDSVPVDGIEPENFRHDSFDIFREQAALSKRMDSKVLKVSNAQLLDNLNLLHNGLPTRAAILLFHHNPEKWIPGSFIKIGFFKSDSEIVYQDEVHGSLLSQADNVIELIYLKYLQGIISYHNITRIETYPYPKDALREAVLNAIAHKNYATLTPVQIRIYENKIMIANDCIFPEDWTVENLMNPHKSRPYNPLIASAFYRAGYIESWGRGIEKISEACRNLGNPQPEYLIHHEDFMITFHAVKTIQTTIQNPIQTTIQTTIQTEEVKLTEKDKAILRAMKEHPDYTQKQLAVILDISLGNVKYFTNKLKKKGIIKRVGSSHNGHWDILIDF